MKFKQISLVIAATALLGACDGMELGTAQKTSPKGDAFSQALYKEYIALSKDEYGEGDYADSDLFAMRAIAAAGGKPTAPEAPDARPQPKRPGALIAKAHPRLVKALAGPGAKANPAAAARAGASDYNSTLAEKRANVVAGALTKLGVSGRLMTIGSLGENANAVETKDGMQESGNRRVEVTVRY